MSRFIKIFLAACFSDARARACLLGAFVLIAGSTAVLSVGRIRTVAPKPCPAVPSGEAVSGCAGH